MVRSRIGRRQPGRKLHCLSRDVAEQPGGPDLRFEVAVPLRRRGDERGHVLLRRRGGERGRDRTSKSSDLRDAEGIELRPGHDEPDHRDCLPGPRSPRRPRASERVRDGVGRCRSRMGRSERGWQDLDPRHPGDRIMERDHQLDDWTEDDLRSGDGWFGEQRGRERHGHGLARCGDECGRRRPVAIVDRHRRHLVCHRGRRCLVRARPAPPRGGPSALDVEAASGRSPRRSGRESCGQEFCGHCDDATARRRRGSHGRETTGVP